MKTINWSELVNKRVLTRVTKTRDVSKRVRVYLREILITACTDSGEQVQFRPTHEVGGVKWGDATGNCIRAASDMGNVEIYEYIDDVTNTGKPRAECK